MRRADRLFRILQYLRGGRLVTARCLAERLAVSERTIYRDIRDMTLCGVPVEGVAGVGYMIRGGFEVPPLMFNRDEIGALVIGARMVESWTGKVLAASARVALAKIEAALPDGLRSELDSSRLFALNSKNDDTTGDTLELVRRAIREHRKLECTYRREDDETSTRVLHSLALYFWGRVWTLVAWCERRQDFRSFRLDRMTSLYLSEERFEETPGQALSDFLASFAKEALPRHSASR